MNYQAELLAAALKRTDEALARPSPEEEARRARLLSISRSHDEAEGKKCWPDAEIPEVCEVCRRKL